ncbi:prepilin-type N-terminal cleavage/methylation domain-containing protein [Desulfomicrobium norvegicum]|uniref:Type II secretion system protein H n=1 Tax=Desulfomicrobium norvegicum (strain DSM 1741 / NCIMB 8310) TaxID=52561 RepID=A0A8G2F6R0_DESNO|nr:GspH/FimT family pseudopilin [Desulfomicrobium norvegicum]SFL97895.1 prepilin-type N-terminal cleavage/methylation domain-containing protein [Desulfomicrobium norvegicum]
MHFENNNQAGMTIVELLVVIAIIGIVAGVTGLNLFKYGPMYELRANARTFYSEMQNAKINAIRTGNPWGFVCNEAASICAIYSSSGPDNDFSTTGDNTLYKTINLSTSKYGIAIGHGTATTRVIGGAIGAEDVTYADDILTFNARGISNDGEIYIQNNRNESYAVGTNKFGNIFLRRWTGGGWN